jgi:hypothetical protein
LAIGLLGLSLLPRARYEASGFTPIGALCRSDDNRRSPAEVAEHVETWPTWHRSSGNPTEQRLRP